MKKHLLHRPTYKASRLIILIGSSIFVALSCLLLAACGGSSNHNTNGSNSSSMAASSLSSSSPATGNQDTSSSGASSGTSGLEVIPSNITCLAPAAVATGDTSVISWPAAFPSLPAIAKPSSMFQLPGANNYWYVLRQPGVIVRFANQPDANSVTEALDITDRVNFTKGGETGLLGVAVHPQFASNHFIFLYYTGSNTVAESGLETRVARYTVNSDGTFDHASEQIILSIKRPFANHIGGQLAFDSKGFLYIASGDGGAAGDPYENGQNLTTLLGKILRIDINSTSSDRNYAIPSDNPYAGNASAREEIWAWGLRNPWRFSFDSSNDELWVGDVGQDTWEEINLVSKGGNYGWGDMEGDSCYNRRSNCSTANKIKPLYNINHSNGSCSVIGGYVYRGTTYPEAFGKYFFTDYCESTVLSITRQSNNTLEVANHGALAAAIVSFAQDNQGELYAIGQVGGIGKQIYKMQATGASKQPGVMANSLSATGCVSTTDPQQPASGLIPYNVETPFWSDGAVKERFMAIPHNKQIDLNSNGDFNLPEGTVLMKHFKLDDRFIETRLFTHSELGWQGFSYEWLDDQTDALLLTDAKDKFVSGVNWHFPSPGQCMTCHTRAAGFSLGVEALQLNSSLNYVATGRTANQLATLEHIGLFTAPLSNSQKTDKLFSLTDTQATLQQRARSYLHSNCSYCHQPNGPTPVNIDLRYTTTLADTHICDVAPDAGDLGITNARILAPAEPARSVLIKRMQVTDSTQMPPLGRTTVDTEAVEIISAWVASLNSCI